MKYVINNYNYNNREIIFNFFPLDLNRLRIYVVDIILLI